MSLLQRHNVCSHCGHDHDNQMREYAQAIRAAAPDKENQMTNKERFEQWLVTQNICPDWKGNDPYDHEKTVDAWEVWQASRAAALEEAKQVCEDQEEPDRTGWYGPSFNDGKRQCAEAIRAMIKSDGSSNV